MKESTYQDLTAVQIEILINAVESKHHNLCGKYKQMYEMRKMYEDEISKINLQINTLEAVILNAAKGVVPVKLNKNRDRIIINTTKAALKKMSDLRKAGNWQTRNMDLKK